MTELPTEPMPPPEELGPPIPPERPAGRRHLRRVALISALVAVVLLLPLALFIFLRSDSTENGAAPPSASPGVSDVPSGTVTTGPTGGSTKTQSGVPNGRISMEELRRSTIVVPPWPQDNLTGRSGAVDFSKGTVTVPPDERFDFPRYMFLGGIAYGDVDRDGAAETIVGITCAVQGGSTQLVALDRDRAGHIVTLGAVVATTGEIRVIESDKVRVANGVVSVRVGDFQRCCGDETPQLWQTRGYAWNGQRFGQVSGPTAFPVNPSVTETTVSTGDLVLGPASDGVRRGVLTVTVGWPRGARPHHLRLAINVPPGIQTDGTAWPPVNANGELVVDLPTPSLGGTARHAFAFRRPADLTGGDMGVDLIGVNASGVGLSESNPFGNRAPVTIRTVG